MLCRADSPSDQQHKTTLPEPFDLFVSLSFTLSLYNVLSPKNVLALHLHTSLHTPFLVALSLRLVSGRQDAYPKSSG